MTRQQRRIAVLALLAAVLSSAAGCASSGTIQNRPTNSGIDSPHAFLWHYPYSKLVVDIQYAEDLTPTKAALESLHSALANVTKKQVSVLRVASLPPGVGSADKAWTPADLASLARSTRPAGFDFDALGTGDTAVFDVYYLDGHYTAADGRHSGVEILGRAFIFPKTDDKRWTDWPLQFETSVLVHEAGHALGLVNCGIPMLTAREDANYPCHSTNAGSVMGPGYEQISLPLEINVTKPGPPPTYFDDYDLADLSAFQSAERS
jgi:hypothetical protein